MLILYTQYTNRKRKIHITTQNSDDILILWCSFYNKEQYCDVYLMMSSRGRYSGFPQQFVHPSCDWIHMLKAFTCSCFSWSLLSEAVTYLVWCRNQWSPPPRDKVSRGSWESNLRTCQISKFHVHLYKVQALSSLRQINLSSSNWKYHDCWVSILACQGVLIIVEPLLICVPMAILIPCKGIHIHQ